MSINERELTSQTISSAISKGVPSWNTEVLGHESRTLKTWLALEWILFHEKVPFKTEKFYAVLTSIGIFLAPLIPVSRYYLNYHSIKQICLGLITGFVLSLIHFCIIMAIIYKTHHRFENSLMTRLLRKLKFKDTYISFEEVSGEESSNTDIEGQIKAKIEAKIIVPLRVGVHRFFWRYCHLAEQAKKCQVEAKDSTPLEVKDDTPLEAKDNSPIDNSPVDTSDDTPQVIVNA